MLEGAQRWVGRAQWHVDAFYLWGDVLMHTPRIYGVKIPGMSLSGTKRRRTLFGDVKQTGVVATGGWTQQLGFGKWGRDHLVVSRKENAATIAKIPPELARHVAHCFRPDIGA